MGVKQLKNNVAGFLGYQVKQNSLNERGVSCSYMNKN